MSDILQFLTVQWTPSGERLGPAMLVFTEGGGQHPENVVNDIPTGFENTALSLGVRAYDRAIRIHNEQDGVAYYAWQQDDVWELFNGSDFQSIANFPAQSTAFDGALHTGLYHVTDGRTFDYVCGLYAMAGSGTGWFKLNLRTKVVTTGTVPGASSFTATMGKCVAYQGKLYHCAANALQEFDPTSDTLREYVAAGEVGEYAKLAVARNRLFVFPQSGSPRVNEFAFGTVVTLGVIDGGNSLLSSYGAGGDSTAAVGLPAINGDIGYWWCAGSTGFRFHYVTVGAGSLPGDAVGITNADVVIPDGGPASQDFNGFSLNIRYPAAGVDPRAYVFTDGGFNLEDGPLYSAVPQAFVMFKLNLGSFVVFVDSPLIPKPGLSRRLDWNGAGAVMNFVNVVGNTSVSVTHSQNSAPWGDPTRLFLDGPVVAAVRTEPYSDGTIARGLRVTFEIRESSSNLADSGAFLYFGFKRYSGRPDERATLSTGDNPTTYPGGVVTFGANRLENVPPSGPGKTTLTHDNTVGAFIIGEIVEGQTSLARGICSIIGGVPGAVAMFTSNGSVSTFQDGEQLLGLTSGATANTIAPPEDKPRYQIIWDVDADGPIPDGEWASLQGSMYEIDSPRRHRTGPTYQVNVQAADPAPPNTTQSDADQIGTLGTGATPLTSQSDSDLIADLISGASPATTQSDSTQIPLNESGPSPLTTQSDATQISLTLVGPTPITTQSDAQQIVPSVDLEPNLLRKVPDRPSVQGGGLVGIEDDAGPVADRAAFEHEDSAVLPGQGWAVKTALPAGPLYSKRLDGKVLLGRATIDAENDAPATRYTLLDVDAAGLGAIGVAPGDLPLGSILGVGLLLVVARAISVNGVITTQPEIRLGVGAPYDNQAAQQVVGMTADEHTAELAVAVSRDAMLAGDVLEAELSVAAVTSGSYVLELLVYGFHRVG